MRAKLGENRSQSGSRLLGSSATTILGNGFVLEDTHDAPAREWILSHTPKRLKSLTYEYQVRYGERRVKEAL